jgi:hypothetical protein
MGCAQGRCATRLRYAPTCKASLILNYVGALRLNPPALKQAEIDFDGRLYGDRLPVLGAGIELPLADGLKRLLIETHTKAANDLHILCSAIDADSRRNDDRALIRRGARFLGVLRLDFVSE